MERASGVIRNAKTLFRLVMLYATHGGSCQQTALGMALTENIRISKVGVFKRIAKSGEWLRQLCDELLKTQGYVMEKPAFLGDRDVVLYDASDEAAKGSKRTDYRLHFGFDPFGCRCREWEITGAQEGEKLTRYAVKSGEIVIADRIYCTITGIEHVLSGDGAFVLRYKSKGFKLYTTSGQPIELLPLLRHLGTHESTDIHTFYRLPESGKLQPIRIVAMKKDPQAIEESQRKLARKVSRKQEKPVYADTVELNDYVVLATNLDYTNEQILELYRTRWQIEQVFYRLKSLFGYGNTPNKRDDTCKTWFYAKLLLAVLCETIRSRVDFPPEMEPYLAEFISAKFLG